MMYRINIHIATFSDDTPNSEAFHCNVDHVMRNPPELDMLPVSIDPFKSLPYLMIGIFVNL